MHVDLFGLSRGLPFPTPVLKQADSFFLVSTEMTGSPPV